MNRKGWVALAILVLLLGTACRASSEPAGAPAGPVADEAAEGEAFGRVAEGGSAARPQSGLPAVGPAVIKTAEIRVEVRRGTLDEAVGSVTAAAGRYAGFVSSTHITGGAADREVRSGTLVIRVPAESFERALADIRELGTIKAETISGQDVTQEFVDLEARLRNWRSQEAVLLRLMDRAQNVSESIKVQRELQQVQLEVEMIQGRLRFLRDQTSFGTITASLREAAPASAKAGQGTLARAWDRAVELFVGLVSALVYGVIVGGAVLLPLAALGILGLVVYRLIRPRLGTLKTP